MSATEREYNAYGYHGLTEKLDRIWVTTACGSLVNKKRLIERIITLMLSVGSIALLHSLQTYNPGKLVARILTDERIR